jgi:hypothetical protein
MYKSKRDESTGNYNKYNSERNRHFQETKKIILQVILKIFWGEKDRDLRKILKKIEYLIEVLKNK